MSNFGDYRPRRRPPALPSWSGHIRAAAIFSKDGETAIVPPANHAIKGAYFEVFSA
jgi:hypothetical protein